MQKTPGLFRRCHRRTFRGPVVLAAALVLAITLTGLSGAGVGVGGYAGMAHAAGGTGGRAGFARPFSGSGPTVVQVATADYMTGARVTTTPDGTGYEADASVSLPGIVAAGDELVLLVGWGGGSQWAVAGNECYSNVCTAGLWSGSSGNSMFAPGGGGWSQPVDSRGDGAAIGLAPVTTTTAGISAGARLLSENCSPGGFSFCSTWVQVTLTLVEVSGEDPNALDPGGPSGPYALYSGWSTLTENGDGGTVHTTNTGAGLGASASDLDLAIYVDGGSDKTVSAPSGESQVGSNNTPITSTGHDQARATAASSVTFDSSGTAGYVVIAAVSIAGPGPAWHLVGTYSGNTAQTLTTINPLLGPVKLVWACEPIADPAGWAIYWFFSYNTGGGGGGVTPCDAQTTTGSIIAVASGMPTSVTISTSQQPASGGNWTAMLEMYYATPSPSWHIITSYAGDTTETPLATFTTSSLWRLDWSCAPGTNNESIDFAAYSDGVQFAGEGVICGEPPTGGAFEPCQSSPPPCVGSHAYRVDIPASGLGGNPVAAWTAALEEYS